MKIASRCRWIGILLPAILAAMAQNGWAAGALPLGLPPVPVPQDNPQTEDRIALGKALFIDQRLSSDGKVSCATCHDPKRAFSDGRPTAEGLRGQRGTRNTPTVVNAAYYSSQYWDGRRPSLEEQAKDPFVDPIEHGLANHDRILAVIKSDGSYIAAFGKAFAVKRAAIGMEHVVKAIAAFERTLLSGNSAFDRYFYGGDKSALSARQVNGLEIFMGRGRCASCHTIGEKSSIFTDNGFHSLGVGYRRIESHLAQIAVQVVHKRGHNLNESVGRRQDLSELGRFALTLSPADIGKFKTPGLRNVAVTAPYMHDGSVQTLQEAVRLEVYYRGSEANRPLILTPGEEEDLAAFLESLTSAEYARE